MKARLWISGLAALALLCIPLTAAHGEEPAPDAVFKKQVPQGAGDLRAIEQAAREIAAKVVPCTVGLQVGAAQGSGIIVSEEGLVLTAAHVVGQPNRDVRVRFPDGKIVKGKTLGMHLTADGGLVKITD